MSNKGIQVDASFHITGRLGGISYVLLVMGFYMVHRLLAITGTPLENFKIA